MNDIKEKNKFKFASIINSLKDSGVSYIQIYYAGGGDSGCIEEIGYYCKHQLTEEEVTYEEFKEWRDYGIHPNAMDYTPTTKFEEDIENWATETILNNIEDWWNNDGGFGVLSINLEEGTYCCNNNCYRQEVDSYDHEGSYGTPL